MPQNSLIQNVQEKVTQVTGSVQRGAQEEIGQDIKAVGSQLTPAPAAQVESRQADQQLEQAKQTDAADSGKKITQIQEELKGLKAKRHREYFEEEFNQRPPTASPPSQPQQEAHEKKSQELPPLPSWADPFTSPPSQTALERGVRQGTREPLKKSA